MVEQATLPPATHVPPAPRSGRPTRLALLDALRLVAALAVVAYHFTALNHRFWGVRSVDAFPVLHHVTRYGYLGVELFFFISGFVILMTAWGRDLPAYTASRVARLFPAYWVGVLLTGGLLLLTGKVLKDVSVGQVLTNLTMLQTPNGVDNVDGVYWTLWVEMRFYLLIGVFILIGITRQRVIALAVIWPLVGAMAASADQTFLSELLMAEWSPYFAVGMLLYLVHREGWSPLLAFLCGGGVILAMSQASEYSAIIERKAGAPANHLVAAGAVVLCFALVAAVTTTRLGRIDWRWASVAGALTYPLYLIHEYWGVFLISHLHEHLGRALTLAVTLAAVLAMAWAINRFAERPFASRMRRSVEHTLRATPPAVAGSGSGSARS